jgi:thiamine kinase-like enzyme
MFEGVLREAVELEPLGSLTNSTFKVTVDGAAYVLRLPGKDTADYIDRTAEKHNALIATAAGINAGIFYFDVRDGTMLSRFIEGTALTGEKFEREPFMPVRAALALRHVHSLGSVFRTRFDVFDMLDKYRALVRGMRTPVAGGHTVLRGAEAVCRALEASPAIRVPCHNDPWPGNFVDAGEQLYLIDWEFSGMNDPMWDLADFSVEAGFGPKQDRTLVEAYHGGPFSPAVYSRLELYKAMSDLLWAYWGFVQVANDNPRDDFPGYARRRLEGCEARMSGADFPVHLNAVRESRWRDAPQHVHPTSPEPRIPVLREPLSDGRQLAGSSPL